MVPHRGAKVYAASPMASGLSRRDLLRLVAAGSIATSVHAAGPRYSIAQTRAGKIAGVRERGVHVFKGVPYGADTASRRFRPPVAVGAWKKILDAFEYGRLAR